MAAASKRPAARKAAHSAPDSLFGQLANCKQRDKQAFEHAWVGLEPTFSSAKAVNKWHKMASRPGGEDAYFESRFMLRKLHDVARGVVKRYRSLAKKHDPACLFAECELEFDRDPWNVERANLRFLGSKKGEVFEVRFGMDPETFEFSIKPVPLAWFYNPRFVRFLEMIVWGVPREHGLTPSMAHGGGQFSFSAKTFLQGSLLADDIATKLNHPELASWILDYPNPDDRVFRATARRRRAFETVLAQYWAGSFHPRALGLLTAENALFDRGFAPVSNPPKGLMDPARGPRGNAREIFQTNFAFARTVRWQAQNVDPGYWLSAHPDEDGYRADQIMRYSEGNLNRLQIAGEWHVKSGKVLDPTDVAEFDTPLDLALLYDEAGWEQRGQMAATRAVDMVEAVLLDAHHARWLLEHPHVRVRSSLAQDQLLGDAERTLARYAPKVLAKLRKAARADNLAASRKRVKSDRIEPEALFWAAWRALPPGGRAEIAREAITGFLARVEEAAACDPRQQVDDPMDPHRHRIHPQLWEALEAVPNGARPKSLALELRRWREQRETYLARRPIWSVTAAKAPWDAIPAKRG